MDAIAVRELDFSYGSSRILKKIDLAVPEGGFAVLLGENGAGKSTFLKLLLGELPIGGGEGKILLFGRDIRQFKSWQDAIIGLQASSSAPKRKTRYNCLLGIIFKIWKIQVEDAFVHS